MKKKYTATAKIMALILASVTGCGQDTEQSYTPLSAALETDADTLPQKQNEKDEGDITENDNSEKNSSANDISDNETMCIGGKVRSVAQDSFVISRTLLEENSSIVIMPEEGSPEEELVTVRCTDSTIFERWTIKGGGADIVKENASFSDIHKGGGLETEGYFVGEDFFAEKVMIEIYK